MNSEGYFYSQVWIRDWLAILHGRIESPFADRFDCFLIKIGPKTPPNLDVMRNSIRI